MKIYNLVKSKINKISKSNIQRFNIILKTRNIKNYKIKQNHINSQINKQKQ